MLQSLILRDLRGYASLDVEFGPGPHLIWGPNAAGKTSLLEAIALLAWGQSHRTSTDSEMIRWGADLARVEGTAGPETLEVALVRPGSPPVAGVGGRKRIRINGVPRRATALLGLLRTVLFAPEEMLLVIGAPGLRRAAMDRLAGQRSPAYARDLATYARALQQRNSLLRAIREEQASRDQLRVWDAPLIESGAAVVAERLRLLEAVSGPLARAHAEIAPEEAAGGELVVRYLTNAPALP
ncbi:MAG TPA: DNA replication and repair protein RecF, partial [Vitreimonas sp.]|nr:DNA replication and repair protein RecF [Vitreimonas sp.]